MTPRQTRAAIYCMAIFVTICAAHLWASRLVLGMPPGHEVQAAVFAGVAAYLIERLMVKDET